MIKRGQIFVRARDETGKWGSADVLDLNEESFRTFILRVLFDSGMITGIKDTACEGQHVGMEVKPGIRLD